MKKVIIIFCVLFFSFGFIQAQTYKYYIYLSDYKNAPAFTKVKGLSVYSGTKLKEKEFFSNKNIINFQPAFADAIGAKVKNIFYLETTNPTLVSSMKKTFPTTYLKSEDVTNLSISNLMDYYPNDYGTSSPNPNLGYNFNRKEWDYLHVPKAWGITTGNSSIKIGIIDNPIYHLDPDFIGKIEQIEGQLPSTLAPSATNWNLVDFHGYDVAATAAGRGDNGYGSAGVCMDCSIVSSTNFTVYGSTYPINVIYSNLYKLAIKGAKVINMSWLETQIWYTNDSNAGIEAHQLVIDEIVNAYRVTLVAASGNRSSFGSGSCSMYGSPYGILYVFPASYNNVISVSTVGHKNPLQLPLTPSDQSYESTSSLYPIYMQIEDSFSSWISGLDPNNPIGVNMSGYYQSVTNPCGMLPNLTVNDKVDILAPGIEVYGHHTFFNPNLQDPYYGLTSGTSFSAPTVSGTIGLMLSLNDCLTPSETEDIIQLTAKDVENMPINQNYLGLLGAGRLEVGDAVEFTNEIKKNDGNAFIKNHIFNRFDFTLNKINNNLKIENVTFKDACKTDFTAKNQITLLPGTNLKPDLIGSAHLSINTNIDIACSPIIFPTNKISNNSISNKSNKLISDTVLLPNPNNGNFKLINIQPENFGNEEINLNVYDINGKNMYAKKLNKNDIQECQINLLSLPNGIYIVRLSSSINLEYFKFIKN